MSSRRKKKRNRQLPGFGQDGSIPNNDINSDEYLQDDSVDEEDVDEDGDEDADYDESLYGDVDRDYRDGYETEHEDTHASYPETKAASQAAAHQKPERGEQNRTETVHVKTDPAPPPLPQHESGPHIKFPQNAKRKSPTSEENSTGAKTSRTDLPRKAAASLKKMPNLLKFLKRKNQESSAKEASTSGTSAGKPSASLSSTKETLRSKIAKRKAKKASANTVAPAAENAADSDPAEPRAKRRWKTRVAWMLFLLAALVWFLPLIVTKTPLFRIVLSMATEKLDGTARVKSVSCGWFSGISVAGLDIQDRQGNTVVQVPAIEGDRTLLGLLWNSSKLGRFQMEKPVVHVSIDSDGSTNVEKLIAGYLEGPSGDPFDLDIKVTDAKVIFIEVVSDASTAISSKNKKEGQPLATLSGVDVVVQMLADPNAPASTLVQVSGTVDDATKKGTEKSPAKKTGSVQPGQFNAELALGRENRMTVGAEQILFDRFAPLLAKMTSGLQLQGSLSGQVDCRWGEVAAVETKTDKAKKEQDQKDSLDDLLVKATARLDGFSATGGPLGTDRLVLSQPKLACQLSSKDGVYILREANLDSELATLALDGQVVFDAGSFAVSDSAGTSPAAKAVTKQTFDLTGRVDLVRLAEMLPTTLHLHDQTQVNSGELTLKVSAVKGENLAPLASGETPIVWNAQVETSNITAMRRGQQLIWHQPITLTLDAHEMDGGRATIDQLLCNSYFFQVEAAGNHDALNATASFDLSRLMNQLGAFVNLGGLQMRGQGWANLNWRRAEVQNGPPVQGGTPVQGATPAQATASGAMEGFVLDGDCQLRDLEISVAQPTVGDLVPIGNPTPASSDSLLKQPWQESRVVMIFSATGRMPDEGPVSLASAEVRLQGDTEQIVARLTQPVKEITAKTVWPVAIEAQGQLGRWTDRAHAFGIASDWATQGVYDAKVGGSYQTETMKFDNVAVKVNRFQVAGPSVRFNEPQLELILAGHYEKPRSRLFVTHAQCKTSAAMFTAQELIVGTPSDGPLELAGTLGVEGDLARMQGWIANSTQPSNWTYQGYLKGTANLKQIKGIVSGQVEANIQHLQLSDLSGHRFNEPNLILVADGKYDNTSRVVEFTQAQLTSSVLNGRVKGKLLSGSEPMETDLAGSVDCNMQRLSELLVPYLGNSVVFHGQNQSEVKLAGPMTLAQAHAKAGLGWDSAELYGFTLGRGKLDFSLADGLVSSSPLKMPISEGQVQLSPQLRVAPGAMQIELPPGTVVDNVRINQQMCAGGLKYIAPVLADVATADGRFSISIDQCRLPIDNMGSGDLAGKFKIHTMTIGAGPLLQQLTPVLKQANSAQLQKESVVTFRMKDGRVYHEGLELVFPDDVTIKTHGYVGLDESLSIIAEMPVPKVWIDKTGGSINPALQGQKIMLPIAGTLSRPQLNQQQMQKAMQQFIGKAATNVLQTEGQRLIDQQLNRLFQPR